MNASTFPQGSQYHLNGILVEVELKLATGGRVNLHVMEIGHAGMNVSHSRCTLCYYMDLYLILLSTDILYRPRFGFHSVWEINEMG
jgi:hypothetical protein